MDMVLLKLSWKGWVTVKPLVLSVMENLNASSSATCRFLMYLL